MPFKGSCFTDTGEVCRPLGVCPTFCRQGDKHRSKDGDRDECPTNSLRLLQHDRDGLRDLVAALVLGRDAHDPAWLEIGQREWLLDEPCLARLGWSWELDDLCLGFEDDGHVARLTLRRRLERQDLGRCVDRFNG